jgi:hypothetical protein
LIFTAKTMAISEARFKADVTALCLVMPAFPCNRIERQPETESQSKKKRP